MPRRRSRQGMLQTDRYKCIGGRGREENKEESQSEMEHRKRTRHKLARG